MICFKVDEIAFCPTKVLQGAKYEKE